MANSVPEAIENAFEAYPAETRPQLHALRQIIFDVAGENATIGPLTETLKWGQPSYLTEKTKSGTTIRLGARKADGQASLYVHCQTNLVQQIREIYPDAFDYEGTRQITPRGSIFDVEDELRHVVGLALTYHTRK